MKKTFLFAQAVAAAAGGFAQPAIGAGSGDVRPMGDASAIAGEAYYPSVSADQNPVSI